MVGVSVRTDYPDIVVDARPGRIVGHDADLLWGDCPSLAQAVRDLPFRATRVARGQKPLLGLAQVAREEWTRPGT